MSCPHLRSPPVFFPVRTNIPPDRHALGLHLRSSAVARQLQQSCRPSSQAPVLQHAPQRLAHRLASATGSRAGGGLGRIRVDYKSAESEWLNRFSFSFLRWVAIQCPRHHCQQILTLLGWQMLLWLGHWISENKVSSSKRCRGHMLLWLRSKQWPSFIYITSWPSAVMYRTLKKFY